VFAGRRAALRGVGSELVASGLVFVPIIEASPAAEQPAAKTAARVPEPEIDVGGAKVRLAVGGVIPPFLTGFVCRIHAARFSF